MKNLREVNTVPELQTNIGDSFSHLTIACKLCYRRPFLSKISSPPVGWLLGQAGQLEGTGPGHWCSPWSRPKKCSCLRFDVHHDLIKRIQSSNVHACSSMLTMISSTNLDLSMFMFAVRCSQIDWQLSCLVSNFHHNLDRNFTEKSISASRSQHIWRPTVYPMPALILVSPNCIATIEGS